MNNNKITNHQVPITDFLDNYLGTFGTFRTIGTLPDYPITRLPTA